MKSFAFKYRFGISKAILAAFMVTAASISVKAGNVDSANYYKNLAQNENAARHYLQALRFYEKAAAFNPSDADAQISIAEVCVRMNKHYNAIQALEKAIMIRPQDSKALRQLTNLYFTSNQWEATIKHAKTLMRRDQETQGLAFMMGKSYYHQQDYANGLPALKSAIKEDPNSAEANYLIGRMNVLMSNFLSAVPYYKQSLALDQTSQPNRFYEYAQVLAMAGSYDESILQFESALDKGLKARDDFYMNYAYTLSDAKQTNKALDVFNKMLVRRPQDIALREAMADVCYHSKRYNEAVGHWDQVLALKKDDARTIYHIGLAYIKMGRDEDGKKLCDQAIAIEPALAVLRHQKSMSF